MRTQPAALLALALVALPLHALAQATPAERQEEIVRGLGMDPTGSEGHYLRGTPLDRLPPSHRETRNLRIAQEPGLAYLPLMVMRQYRLVEKHARALDHPQLRVSWARLPSPTAMNDALRAGFLDVAAGSPTALLRAWDRGDGRVRGVAALARAPLYLNARGEGLETLADLAPGDPIALPGPASHQATLLRMAAAREAESGRGPLRARLVFLPHPAAVRALAEGRVRAHFAAPPYQYEELALPGVRRLLSSARLADGPTTTSALWARVELPREHPRTYQALTRALDEAMGIIADEPRRAAESFRLQSDTSLAADELEAMLTGAEVSYGTEPAGFMGLARFLHREGAIDHLPRGQAGLFINEGLPGP